MPGRAPRNNEARLVPKQHALARRVLQRVFDPRGEITQWSEPEKQQLVHAINGDFVRAGFSPVYTVRKLDDWISNAKYRATCKQRKAHPTCWTTESRSKARAKARDAKRQEHRRQAVDESRGLSGGGGGGGGGGNASTTEVEKLRQMHYSHMSNSTEQLSASSSSAAAEFSWKHGSAPDDALAAAKGRAEAFASIRARFEQDGFGRTDPFACHRGPLAATGVGDDSAALAAAADAPLQSGTAHGSTEDSKLVPTFLVFGGGMQVPLPKTPPPPMAPHESYGLPLSEAEEMTMDSMEDCLPLEGWRPSTDISALEAAMSPPARSTGLELDAAGGGDDDEAAGRMGRSMSCSSSCSSSASDDDSAGDMADDEDRYQQRPLYSEQPSLQQQHRGRSESGFGGFELPVGGADWDQFLERNLDSLPAFEGPAPSNCQTSSGYSTLLCAPPEPWIGNCHSGHSHGQVCG